VIWTPNIGYGNKKIYKIWNHQDVQDGFYECYMGYPGGAPPYCLAFTYNNTCYDVSDGQWREASAEETTRYYIGQL
jgi:hypothetical protein